MSLFSGENVPFDWNAWESRKYHEPRRCVDEYGNVHYVCRDDTPPPRLEDLPPLELCYGCSNLLADAAARGFEIPSPPPRSPDHFTYRSTTNGPLRDTFNESSSSRGNVFKENDTTLSNRFGTSSFYGSNLYGGRSFGNF